MLLVISCCPSAYGESEIPEKEMWDYLLDQYGSPVAAAAIMGNAWGESSMIPYRLSNDVEPDKSGVYILSRNYARKVDSGEISRDDFINAAAGYDSFGLFAWYGPTRKTGLYDYARLCGASISDWEMQLDYAYMEIVSKYYTLYSILLTETDIKTATDAFTMHFERAASFDVDSGKRVAKAREYYRRFCSREWAPEREFGDMLPIYGSYDYLDRTVISRSDKECSIYAYMLQEGLAAAGYIQAQNVSGYFQGGTESAVRLLQHDYGLEETGIVTPTEWDILAKLNGIR